MTSLIAIGPFATASGLLTELGASIQAAGLLQALVLAVFGGLLTCLTPCVYPLIPITLSIFGACGAKSSRQAFLLSLAYVLGIAITYSILGLLAAASGSVFGSLLGNPWVIGAICGCLIFLSIYNLDLLTFSLGQGLSRFANSLGGKGYRGAFVMGMASGIVAAPCVGPVLLSILVIAAASGSAWKGGLLLFFYALGFGCPFLVLGSCSSLLCRLPKSGKWLAGVKFLLAAATLAVALLLASPLFRSARLTEPQDFSIPVLLLFLIGGLLLGRVSHIYSTAYQHTRRHKTFRAITRTLGALALATALIGLILPNTESRLSWNNSISATIAEAAQRKTIAMVDLSADWCGACKEFEAVTFHDPTVVAELQRLSLGKIDFTTTNPTNSELSARYQVAGLPCILFLNADGVEIANSRITGFLDPREFLGHLRSLGLATP